MADRLRQLTEALSKYNIGIDRSVKEDQLKDCDIEVLIKLISEYFKSPTVDKHIINILRHRHKV